MGILVDLAFGMPVAEFREDISVMARKMNCESLCGELERHRPLVAIATRYANGVNCKTQVSAGER